VNSKILTRAAVLPAVVLFSLAAVGCNEHSSYSDNPDRRATTTSLSIEPSSREIVSGETVTFSAHTTDTYGRDADINWSSTAGDLKREENGRIARVTFKDVGTYTVKAALVVDGKTVQTDMVEIRVKPIR